MKNIFCSDCEEKVKTDIVQKEETFTVKGEKVSVPVSVLVCSKCKNELFDEELDSANLASAYNEYRKQHSLLLPSKIREIRERYGLSQRSLGRLLEWGEITVNRYETGEIQDAVHNEVLELIDNPENMRTIFEKNMHLLSPSVREALKKRIDDIVQNTAAERFELHLSDYLLKDRSIDEYSGYKSFDLEKMQQMIVYLLNHVKSVYKTAINKYLWYMDFLSFKEYSVSISGSRYVHLPYGPVPDNYDIILDLMLSKMVDKEEVVFKEDIVGERFVAKVAPDLTDFEKEEIKVMDRVISHFCDFNASQLSKYSHKEKAYIETENGEKISYELSKELTLDLAS